MVRWRLRFELSAPSATTGEEGIAVHVEGTCLCLASGAAERVDGRTEADMLEPRVFEHLLPARTGQPAGNSTGP